MRFNSLLWRQATGLLCWEGKMNALIINCSPVKNGATAEIVKIANDCIKQKYDTTTVCIDDYKFNFCKGCRTCHSTAKCIQHDDFDSLIKEFEKADIIISVAPSYWADVPGQFKASLTGVLHGAILMNRMQVFQKGKKVIP